MINKMITDDLDKEQILPVNAEIGDICVFAVAGSGKTRVLTYRVANLLKNDVPEESILVLTFTNKAAGEMTERIKNILGKSNLSLSAGTFHGFACKMLRKYASALDKGYSENFTILDEDGEEKLMKLCISDSIASKRIDKDSCPSAKNLVALVSTAFNFNISINQTFDNMFDDSSIVSNQDEIINIIEAFKKIKIDSNSMGFDDLLENLYLLLQNPTIKTKINNRYLHIMVDEYQDVNWVQYEILKQLNAHHSLFAIGDSSQCIYQFRGSDDSYITKIEEDYPDVQIFQLTYNYRSTPQILKVAEDSINYNDVKFPVKLNTLNDNGPKPVVLSLYNAQQQAKAICRIIIDKFKNNLSGVAILIRSRSQAIFIEKELAAYGIPYNMIGLKGVGGTAHYQDMISLLKYLYNRKDISSFLRFATLFSGVGEKKASSLYKQIESVGAEKVSSNKKEITALLDFLIKIINIDIDTPNEVLGIFYHDFYKKYLQLKYENHAEREQDVEYLIEMASEYHNIELFLDFFSLLSPGEDAEQPTERVSILTMHKSKGLEWDYVFLPSIDKGFFPREKYSDYRDNSRDIQNERKLFYVAATRAKKMLILSHTYFSFNGETGPSPFLDEFSDEHFVHKDLSSRING